MTTADIQNAVRAAAKDFPIRKVWLFGSRAVGSFREDSDVDLIVEFSAPVTLLDLARLTQQLEAILQTDVDVIHGPLRDTDFLDVEKEIEIYAA